MPGGGPAFGNQPHEMGGGELALETALRVAVVVIIGVLFGSFVFNPQLDSALRVMLGTIGLPMFVLFVVHLWGCVREIGRKWGGRGVIEE